MRFKCAKQDLDLRALPPRGAASVALPDVAGHVPRPLEEGARNLPRWFLGAAAGFEGAGIARELARAVEERRAVVDQCAPVVSVLPAGQT
jgi:predicted naringenin-chalcone synthase